MLTDYKTVKYKFYPSLNKKQWAKLFYIAKPGKYTDSRVE